MLAASAGPPPLWGGCSAAPLNVTQRQTDVSFVDNQVKLFAAQPTAIPSVQTRFTTVADVCASLGYGTANRQQITVTATATRSLLRSSMVLCFFGPCLLSWWLLSHGSH
jgi:hypothetical protein